MRNYVVEYLSQKQTQWAEQGHKIVTKMKNEEQCEDCAPTVKGNHCRYKGNDSRE